MNPYATAATLDLNSVIAKWLIQWNVPEKWWFRWKHDIDVQVYDLYPPYILNMGVNPDTPAVSWFADGKRHMAVKSTWLNPGVIAHEQAHNSFNLLHPDQKMAFASLHSSLKKRDSPIQQLYSVHPFGLVSNVEGHAEIYRYLGQYMPDQLKQFYPTLF
jgi:hypothetical protein